MKDLPIGVFDSGIGGLTVLNELVKEFPGEDFVYIADTINLPYGTKSKEALREIVSDAAAYLAALPVKCIVIACNTASANSAHLVKTINIPVIGVIEPTAKAALKESENLLVLATKATIESGIYRSFIDANKKDPNSCQFYCKCGEFVTAIERNEIRTPYSYRLVEEKLKGFRPDKTGIPIGAVVCGCTHFGLYADELRRCFPDARLIESGQATAAVLKEVLKKKNLLRESKDAGKITVCVTGSKSGFKNKIQWFCHPYGEIKEIKMKGR